MSPEDEQQQKIEAIQARLAKQERTTCLAALLISSALASLGYCLSTSSKVHDGCAETNQPC